MSHDRSVARVFGPLLATFGAGFLAIALLRHPPSANAVSAWVLASVLTVPVVLPLVGLGSVLALLPSVFMLCGAGAFLVGLVAGEFLSGDLVPWFATASGVSRHLYMTVPFSSVAVGLLLISPGVIRKALVVPGALTAGIMLTVTAKLTDPTLHDRVVPRLAALIGIWIVVSALLTLRSVRRNWFHIPVRILGSWLLASGLLFGGAALVATSPEEAPAAVRAQVPVQMPPSDLEDLFPRFDPSSSQEGGQ